MKTRAFNTTIVACVSSLRQMLGTLIFSELRSGQTGFSDWGTLLGSTLNMKRLPYISLSLLGKTISPVSVAGDLGVYIIHLMSDPEGNIPLLVRRRSSVQIKSWPLEQWV